MGDGPLVRPTNSEDLKLLEIPHLNTKFEQTIKKMLFSVKICVTSEIVGRGSDLIVLIS